VKKTGRRAAGKKTGKGGKTRKATKGGARRLAGRCLVITRAEERAGDLGAALEREGAEVLTVPAISHQPAGGRAARARAIAEAEASTHLLFTSATTVRFFVAAAREAGRDPARFRALEVGAVGEATARALAEVGLDAAFTAGGRGGAALAREFLERRPPPGARVFIPQSASARPELAAALREAGVAVRAVAFYRTVAGAPARARPLLARLAAGEPPDAVLFTSPSTLDGFLEMTGPAGFEALRRGALRIVAIGPTTSAAIRARGLEVAAEAGEASAAGLVAALVKAVARLSGRARGRASRRRQ
jgi:uroporphyrinogen-III synthase